MILHRSALDTIRRIQAREFAKNVDFSARPLAARSALERLLLASAGDRSFTFDANMGLSDGSAAIAATGYAQYAGADGIVDLGGNQNVTVTLPSIADVSTITPQQPRIDAVVQIYMTAVTTSGTAVAKLIVVGSNNPAFTAGTTTQLGMMEFGAIASQEQVNGFITAAPPAVGGSEYEILFTNEQNNVKYQFVKLYVVIANSGSVTFRANVVVLPEP
jgi:hypothetical protein